MTITANCGIMATLSIFYKGVIIVSAVIKKKEAIARIDELLQKALDRFVKQAYNELVIRLNDAARRGEKVAKGSFEMGEFYTRNYRTGEVTRDECAIKNRVRFELEELDYVRTYWLQALSDRQRDKQGYDKYHTIRRFSSKFDIDCLGEYLDNNISFQFIRNGMLGGCLLFLLYPLLSPILFIAHKINPTFTLNKTGRYVLNKIRKLLSEDWIKITAGSRKYQAENYHDAAHITFRYEFKIPSDYVVGSKSTM